MIVPPDYNDRANWDIRLFLLICTLEPKLELFDPSGFLRYFPLRQDLWTAEPESQYIPARVRLTLR
jgi:hypothetical protein